MFFFYVLLIVISLVFHFILLYIKREFISCTTVNDRPRRYPVVGSLFTFWRNRSRQLEWYTEMLSDSPTQTIVVEQHIGLQTVMMVSPNNVEHIVKMWFENLLEISGNFKHKRTDNNVLFSPQDL